MFSFSLTVLVHQENLIRCLCYKIVLVHQVWCLAITTVVHQLWCLVTTTKQVAQTEAATVYYYTLMVCDYTNSGRHVSSMWLFGCGSRAE